MTRKVNVDAVLAGRAIRAAFASKKTMNVGDEGESKPIPHYPGDQSHVLWCRLCQRYRTTRKPGQSFPDWEQEQYQQRWYEEQHKDHDPPRSWRSSCPLCVAVMECDDCGRTDGSHDYDTEH